MIPQPENYNSNIIEELDEWSLIQKGYFKQAIIKADTEYAKTRRTFHLRNKLYALLHLEEYEVCASVAADLIQLEGGSTSVDFIFLGICNWLLDKQEAAINSWKGARNSTYKDAGGGIDIETIIYFASIKTHNPKLKDESTKAISRLLKFKRGNSWPKPLGQYLMGTLNVDELLGYVSATPILKERNLCQAYFVIGIKKLENNDLAAYKSNMDDIIRLGPASYLEQMFYLAKGELFVLSTS